MSVPASFQAATRAWFEATFAAPTRAQTEGWEAIGDGHHTLIHAPTGSGKTLAAFLWMIDTLLHEPVPEPSVRCRVLYVSPMKALAYDIERNLRAPLKGIRHAADRLGLESLPEITTFLRTGDTPQDERRRMVRSPADILITTPESLYLMLTSQAASVLSSVRWIIADEVHAVAGTKRGAHLSLSLERLEQIAPNAQRIGLSATQRPLETIASFLVGGVVAPDGQRTQRPVTIVDAGEPGSMDLEIVVPVEDMSAPASPDPLDPSATQQRSIWPAVYPRILELINAHTSTIVFANSRRLAERICGELNELAGEDIARSHHGSVSREQRLQIEEALKRGDLKAVVATSSLELGIDMGAVDLVIQVEAPTSVASGLQRVGRAGHQVDGVSVAKIFPKYRGDLLVSAVVGQLMEKGAVEPTRIPVNALDVLAQQIVASVVSSSPTADDLYHLVRGAAPYADLPRSVFDATLDMLAGRYPSDLFSELRPRITWDRMSGALTPRPGARMLAVSNSGTIPDRGLYRVVLPDGSRVGELDEEMVYESRPGDVFLLGSSTWRITDIGVDRVEVLPAPGEPGAKLPFWHGDTMGRPLETGQAIGQFVGTIAGMEPQAARTLLRSEFGLDDFAAGNLVAYIGEEQSAVGVVPTDRRIVIQRFRDEIGDWRLVLLSPMGARIHAPWAMAALERIRRGGGPEVDVIWSDDGIAMRFPDMGDPPDSSDLLLEPDEIEDLLMDHLAESALFAARFREAAGRSLLLPRRRPGERTPLWLQRRKAAGLLSVAKQFGSFPIVLETYREILQDDFDVDALRAVLASVAAREIAVTDVEMAAPSPFATSLLFAFVAAYLYEADTPLAERRAAAMTLDKDLLRELLGEGELRELLSGDVIDAVDLELQHLMPERAIATVDGITVALADLGPLTSEELDDRADDLDIDAALTELVRTRRVIEVGIGGIRYFAAVEDAARLRDGLGAQPPAGTPAPFLEPVADPLGDLVGRYARTHGPFTPDDVARRLHLGSAVVTTVLERLERENRVVSGQFSPGRSGSEWVGTEVLRRIKRRSLAELRGEVEPVEPAAVGRFLPGWQGVSDAGTGPSMSVEAIIDTLQGAAVPASVLGRDLFRSRGHRTLAALDELLVIGEVVWVGHGSIGTRDGRLALYRREQLPMLLRPIDQDLDSAPAAAIVKHLDTRGASFFPDLYAAAGGGDPGLVAEAIWDLVWAGVLTNDTLHPVRAFVSKRTKGGRARDLSRSTPAHVGGRWSLVSDHLSAPASDTERAAAWSQQLLARFGVVTRSATTFEGFPGGFTSLYPVFARLEETGRIRRGYFVEGQGGAQFASPGAVDRLRSQRDSGMVMLAATDPANPYGGVLPWPEANVRLARSAGAYVLLMDGALGGFVEPGGRTVTVWDDALEPATIAHAMAEVASRHRRFTVKTINNEVPVDQPLASALREIGFVVSTRGLAWHGPRSES